jgi:hypothetical protein
LFFKEVENKRMINNLLLWWKKSMVLNFLKVLWETLSN